MVVFDGLSNVANLRSAELGEKAGVLEAERTDEDVVFSVISGYLALIEAGEQLRMAEENLAAQEARERDVRVLVDRGSRPVADLYQQESSVASARSSAVEARYNAGVATQFEVTQARADFVDASSAEVKAWYTLMFQDRVIAYYAGDLDASLGD